MLSFFQVKGKSPVELRKTNLSIISTFADAALDMPVHRYVLILLYLLSLNNKTCTAHVQFFLIQILHHRFRAFLNRLILCLGERDYLWILTLLLLQATGKRKTYLEDDGSNSEKTSKSIKFIEVGTFMIY